jgi:hypothetical protein
MAWHLEHLKHRLTRLENDRRYFFCAARLTATAAEYLGLTAAASKDREDSDLPAAA